MNKESTVEEYERVNNETFQRNLTKKKGIVAQLLAQLDAEIECKPRYSDGVYHLKTI
jgi:hypothetical protein